MPSHRFSSHELSRWGLGLGRASGAQCGARLSVQSLSRVQRFATPWTAARQASLSITNSWSLLRLVSIRVVIPSSPLILCPPPPLMPSVFPSIRAFSSESVLRIRWPDYWSFSKAVLTPKVWIQLLTQTQPQPTVRAPIHTSDHRPTFSVDNRVHAACPVLERGGHSVPIAARPRAWVLRVNKAHSHLHRASRGVGKAELTRGVKQTLLVLGGERCVCKEHASLGQGAHPASSRPSAVARAWDRVSKGREARPA